MSSKHLHVMGILRWRIRHRSLSGDSSSGSEEINFDHDDWSTLRQHWQEGSICETCEQSNSMFGQGNKNADWLIIVAAPDTQSVTQQQWLVGRVGKLLEAILRVLGQTRETVYITSVAKCSAGSITSTCNKLLPQQIKLLKPKFILALGENVVQFLLKSNLRLADLQLTQHTLPGTEIKLIPSLSLQQLLDTPALKESLWHNLKWCLD